ncbi:MAG TPA: exonuclease subunit SbcD [Gemmataceae bacterium]|nr:exonuclease subunit SbcD [Gemmataceae bacterium]
MRILHTADWHLGDRLGRIDRTPDLRRSVERIADYCRTESVDVLLVAGDIFSELSRLDDLRESIEHLEQVFEPFLLGGGTVLALTGNHDNENFCQTLQLVMNLAAPAAGGLGELRPAGRFYLATHPTFLRLAGKDGSEVQFVLMPYPTPSRYLEDGTAQRYTTLEERNRQLQQGYARRLAELQQHPKYQVSLPTVLSAHVHVQGAALPSLFRISEEESIILPAEDVAADFAYVALGHIHQPQCLLGRQHVRYSGSIERLDMGEARDEKSVTLFDIGPNGRQSEPRQMPLPATRLYDVKLHTPLVDDLARLRQQHPDAPDDLVRIEFTYTAGVDNLEATLRELDEIFPRWYARNWTEANALDGTLTVGPARGRSFQDTVRDYLNQELMNHPDPDRDAILAQAETLMKEIQA